jgi:hypothetical protein
MKKKNKKLGEAMKERVAADEGERREWIFIFVGANE